MTMSDKSAAIVRQKDARVLRAFGLELTILLDGEHTGGTLAMWTEITPPGGGPPLRYHLNEDEILHVIEGRVAFFLNGEWTEVSPGGTAFLPREIVHTFKNVGDQPSRMLNMTMPSGFEKFFARCAEEFAKTGEPDMSRIVEIGAEYGIHFVQE
jgi:quercetin dioxygenase-like cupin family protein